MLIAHSRQEAGAKCMYLTPSSYKSWLSSITFYCPPLQTSSQMLDTIVIQKDREMQLIK